MKKFFFLFLLLPMLAPAQRDEYDLAFVKSIPDSLTQPVHLPERDYSDFNYDVITDLKERRKVLIIGSDSLYRQFFSKYRYTDDSLRRYKDSGADALWYNWMLRYHVDSLPVIDFSKKELLVYTACYFCIANCDSYQPCHRNACSFREAWFIREKKQASNTLTTVRRKNLLGFYLKDKPDTNRKWVQLPDISRSYLSKFFEVGQNSSYNYVVGTDSLYYGIFHDFPKDSLPVFDFIRQELVVYISCPQCGPMSTGNKIEGNEYFRNKPRHRNACRYYSWWYIRDKKSITGSGGLVVE